MTRWALVIVCGVWGLSGAGRLAAAGEGKAKREAKPMLFAAYYVWYRTGDHPRFPWWGWTRKEAQASPDAQKERRPGEPPLASCAYPLAGLYDSATTRVPMANTG